MNMLSRLPLFENRRDAGAKLAAALEEYRSGSTIVLAIPNGGVPVAVEVANLLDADMDIIVSRKLPIPLLPGGGFGAVADDGTAIFNEEVLQAINLDEHQINYQVNLVRNEIRQRSLFYRNNRPLAIISGKIAILVDDGLASGYTMLAAVESVKRRNPSRIVVAIPAASAKAVSTVQRTGARVVAYEIADVQRFFIADYYRYWSDLSDSEGLKYFNDYLIAHRERNPHSHIKRASTVQNTVRFRKRLY